MKKFLIGSLVVILLVSAGGYLYVKDRTSAMDKTSKSITFIDVESGDNLTTIGEKLKEEKIIKDVKAFKLVAKIEGIDQIKAGSYIFSPADTPKNILMDLSNGKSTRQLERVTIPEGFEAREIAERLDAKGIVKESEFLEVFNNPDSIGLDEYPMLKGEKLDNLEGLLYPDTYFFPKNYPAKKVAKVMVDRFFKVYNDSFFEKQKELGLTLNEVVTMASIIEREAVKDEERAIISGVFYNRLEIGMPLQSCATVQYLLKERKPVLSGKDIQIKSPYNTYKNKGLPPAPISSVGRKSLEAALYPEEVDYLYFVAKGDGSHTFSKTYGEHMNARKKNLGN